jgi:Domain of unknown function (DUF6484)
MEAFAAEDLQKLWVPAFGVTTGRIVQVNQHGQAMVDFPGNELGPLPARCTLERGQLQTALESSDRLPVLLVFENGDPTLPIIIGCVYDTLAAREPTKQVVFAAESPRELTVDGRRVTIEASEEIVLRCGDSSITLKKNGRIVVKGADIVSRASRTNKLKGATVAIN